MKQSNDNKFYDNTDKLSVDMAARKLYDSTGAEVLNWSTGYPGVMVYKYEKTITQAQLATLDSVSVTISAGDLGLTATQAAKFHQLNTEWWIYPDGIAFAESASVAIVLKTNSGATAITHLPMVEVVGTTAVFTRQSNLLSSSFGSSSVISVTPNDGFYLSAGGGTISGGGPAAYIKVVMYYEKIDF